MKRFQIELFGAGILAISLVAGCNARLPGQPTEAERWRAPAEITDLINCTRRTAPDVTESEEASVQRVR